MGHQGFQVEARVRVQSCIVQERNIAATSYINVTIQVRDDENVHHRQTCGGIPVSHPA